MNQEKWDFTAQPKVVKAKGKFLEFDTKNKEEYSELPPNQYYNLMWDKRVLRGNTYAIVLNEKPTESPLKPSSLRKPLLDKSPKEAEEIQQTEPGTPRALPGRDHVAVETDEFVETLTDKPPFYEKEVQTEFNIEKPPLRHYLPVKTGVSKETQIWDGDLFDFDYEVEPVLQVLLGKTLELSRMEVLEEEELKVMKQQQAYYASLKRKEIEEIKRLEMKEKGLLEEIEKKKFENKKIKEQNISSHKKLIARVMAKTSLKFLTQNTFSKLTNLGIFRNPLESSLYKEYLPFLCNSLQVESVTKEKIEKTLGEWLLGIQQEQFIANKKRVEAFFLEREEQRKEALRLQKEKEERIRKRKEEKARQAEIKRRNGLKNEILERLVSKGELKEKLSSQLLTDIDNYDKETPFVGLLGGLLGEIIIFFNVMQSLGFDKVVHEKKIEKNLTNLLNLYLRNGSIEVALDERILAELPKIDETLTFENLLAANIDKMSELRQLLKESLGSYVINALIENSQEYGINEKLIDDVLFYFWKYVYEQENGKNVKLVKVGKANYKKRVAFCQIYPLLEELPFAEEVLERKEDASDKESLKVEFLSEAELEDKYTVFPPVQEEFRVLVLHRVAEELLRRECLDDLKLDHSELNGREFELLRKMEEISQEILLKILAKTAPKIDVFQLELY